MTKSANKIKHDEILLKKYKRVKEKHGGSSMLQVLISNTISAIMKRKNKQGK
jgi:hypothetical protein